ncbi:GNAT family N-acetyltransferase [Nocardia tengchongensis]|uniref:GNAT family N-acetyltransferase n=1 Tax=Nocardia tengchongensis TaxID=2055889 RepID=UPI0036965BDD
MRDETAARATRGEGRRFLIEPATVADVPGIVEALVDAVAVAYRDLKVEPGKEGVPAMIRDLTHRKPREFEELIAGGGRVFVHRTADGRIAGFAQFSHVRTDASAIPFTFFEGWHVLREYRGTGLAKSLLRLVLLESGDVEIRTMTTRDSPAWTVFKEKLGCVETGGLTPTPAPLAMAGLDARQQSLVLTRAKRRELLDGWLAGF